jgi:hypothetical protein
MVSNTDQDYLRVQTATLNTQHNASLVHHRLPDDVLPVLTQFGEGLASSWNMHQHPKQHKDDDLHRPKMVRTSLSRSRLDKPATVGFHVSVLPGRLRSTRHQQTA